MPSEAGAIAGASRTLQQNSRKPIPHIEATDTVRGRRFVVRFRDDVSNHEALAAQLARAHGGKLLHVYRTVFKGFSIALPEQASDAVVDALRHNPRIQYVVPEQVLGASSSQSPVGWGLDRIDQATGSLAGYPFDNTFNYYQTGAGVNIYIIDSGILGSHPEFGGRFGILSYTSVYPYDPYQDCAGHGTGVASIAAGNTVGVARGATLNSLQVLDCSGHGTDGDIAAAVDFVVTYGQRPAVINLSLGSQTHWYNGVYNPLGDAVGSAARHGVHVVVAAGNDGISACDFNPARVQEAITVGASDRYDQRANFPGWWASDYGPCVDVYAPGAAVDRANNAGGYSYGGGNGTSDAAPYVTGTVALLLSESGSLTPSYVQQIIKGSSGVPISGDPTGTAKLLNSLHTYSTVSGPIAVCGNANYTWQALTYGGAADRTYAWALSYNDGNDEMVLEPSGDGASVTTHIDQSIGDFDIYYTLFTGSDTYFQTMHVYNGICG